MLELPQIRAMAPETPCAACGWSVGRQGCCRYDSHAKLFYGVSDRGVWSVGSKIDCRGAINQPSELRGPECPVSHGETRHPSSGFRYGLGRGQPLFYGDGTYPRQVIECSLGNNVDNAENSRLQATCRLSRSTSTAKFNPDTGRRRKPDLFREYMP